MLGGFLWRAPLKTRPLHKQTPPKPPCFAVGDPLKDTSGPSLNILIKLMAVESLVGARGGAVLRNAISHIRRVAAAELLAGRLVGLC